MQKKVKGEGKVTEPPSSSRLLAAVSGGGGAAADGRRGIADRQTDAPPGLLTRRHGRAQHNTGESS